jgi:hypothetical protein
MMEMKRNEMIEIKKKSWKEEGKGENEPFLECYPKYRKKTTRRSASSLRLKASDIPACGSQMEFRFESEAEAKPKGFSREQRMKGEKASHKVRRKTTQHEHSISAFLMVFFLFFSFILLRFQSIARSVVESSSSFFFVKKEGRKHTECVLIHKFLSLLRLHSRPTLNFFSSSAHP